MPASDAHTHADLPQGSYALIGPSVKAGTGNLPVRGDLAHVRLAGRYFVPHYAVPMPKRVGPAGAALRRAPKSDAEVLADLAADAVFDVLDIAGSWAWGEFGEGGPVGYVALDQLGAQAGE